MFSSKNGDIAFWSTFLTNRNWGHFCTKFNRNFFSFERIFPIFLGPLNMLFVSFGAKMPTLYSGQNSLLDGQKGIFLQTLPLFFFYLFYRLFHVFLRSLNILPTCFQEKMATLHFGRNS